MKGGSREAKELKSTAGGRTWYGKWETLTPLSPPSDSFLEFRFKENVSILEQIMSADKHPCIFPRQIENIVYLATSSLVNS